MESDSKLAPESQAHPAEVPEHRARGPNRGVTLGGGLVALLVLAALGYFYFAPDAGRETASAPRSEQAASRGGGGIAVAPPTAEAPAPPSPAPQQATTPVPPPPPAVEAPAPPSVTAAPEPSATPTPPPASQAPAAQAQAPTTSVPTTSVPTDSVPTTSVPTDSAVRPTPAPPASMQDQPASLPKDEIVYVQKPRVNIRSEPGKKGKVVGSATKGSQFKVVRRDGGWVQIEGDSGAGWIGSRLLGPQAP
jgi:outer membrane biosynthesis protein TonB